MATDLTPITIYLLIAYAMMWLGWGTWACLMLRYALGEANKRKLNAKRSRIMSALNYARRV